MPGVLFVLAGLFVATACGRGNPRGSSDTVASASRDTQMVSNGEAPIQSESPMKPEVNPPGDIPDTQQFVTYSSPSGGFQLEVPEGWARKESGASVSFVDKFDGVRVDLAQAASAPTVASVRSDQAKALQAQGHAVTITNVADVSLPSGPAVRIAYTSNSEANAVTNKKIRLENEQYLYFRNGKLATLTLWAPQGADNADQWRRMSRSFAWR